MGSSHSKDPMAKVVQALTECAANGDWEGMEEYKVRPRVRRVSSPLVRARAWKPRRVE
jgi:hypothetical protein